MMKKKRISTTKLIVFFLFLNCTLIELFTSWVTVKSLDVSLITGLSTDMTPLVTLIGAVVGEVIGFAIYAVKSTKENTQGGVVYDTAMSVIQKEENSNSDNIG